MHSPLPRAKPVESPILRKAIESVVSRQAESPVPAVSDVRAPGARVVRGQIERILASPDFDAPRRSREFLDFVVEEALAGRGEAITQGSIAVRVFGRGDDFDATVDPIVRIQAGRLRRSLERYYLLSGQEDVVRIELPKGSYVPVFRGTGSDVSAGRRAESSAAALPAAPEIAKAVDGWPSVVVRGFEAVGDAAAAGPLALDFSEELALELGRYRTVRVVRPSDVVGGEAAAPGRARFLLEGRLRPDGEDLRVTAHLLDRATGEQVWGDEYHTAPGPERWSGTAEDVARVVAARVGAEEGVVAQLLTAERRRRAPVERWPYDAILLSSEFLFASTSGTLRPALAGLRKVVASEPECGLAWTRLARLCLSDYALEVSALPRPLDEAIAYAHRGVRLDPASRTARSVLASCLLVKGELAAGRAELEAALRSSPGSLVYLEIIGCLLTLLGDWDRGPALSRSARDRNPHCLPFVLFGIWADAVRRGDIERACQVALEFRDPTVFWRSVMRASCLGLLGRTAEAKSELAGLLSCKPDFPARGRILLGHYLKFPEVLAPVIDGLARAGLDAARGWRIGGTA